LTVLPERGGKKSGRLKESAMLASAVGNYGAIAVDWPRGHPRRGGEGAAAPQVTLW
jgi:hypothetical protein